MVAEQGYAWSPLPNIPYAPGLPAWQQQQLDYLAQQNLLSGVPPQYLSVLEQAESGPSYQGGSVNSGGYGGWFGLGQDVRYPAGVASTSLLQGTDPTSYQAQARIAASEYSAQLTHYGNPVAAEQAYQTGSDNAPASGGAKLMAKATGSDLTKVLGAPGASGTGTASGVGDSSYNIFGIPATPPSAPGFFGALNPVSDVKWGFQFLGWAFFTGLIFVAGFTLLVTGGVMLGSVLLGPVSGPTAKAVGKRTPVGRAVRTARRAGGARRAPGGPSRPQGPSSADVDQAFEGGRQRGRADAEAAERSRWGSEGFPSDSPGYEAPRPTRPLRTPAERSRESRIKADQRRRETRRHNARAR